MPDAVDGVLEQWRRERPDIDIWPVGIVGRIMRLARLWEADIKRFLAGHDLEPGEFDVLSTLRRNGYPHELTAAGFLASSLVTSGAITNRIDRMVAKGLVTRDRDENDRRTVWIRLTARGLNLIDDVLPRHVANEARLLQALAAEAREPLADTMRGLLEAWENDCDT